jgi:DNA (cytosine-5)-methyltransferase 1
MANGISPWLDHPTPRIAQNIPHRVDRLKALGNAVVPQVAEYIGRLIINYDIEED